MAKITRYLLVVPASGDKPRIISRTYGAKLKPNEIAYRLTIKIPDGWGRILETQQLEIMMPEPMPEIGLEPNA